MDTIMLSSQITEKRVLTVSPQALTVNGDANGKIIIIDSAFFRVGQNVILKSTNPAVADKHLRVKRIIGNTAIYLGDSDKGIAHRADLSAFTVADRSTLEAIEQKRPSIPEQEIERLTYEEEPVIARRTISIDKHGQKYDTDNPLPINVIPTDRHDNIVDIVSTIVGTTLMQIEVPPKATEYTIFHQTEDGIVHWGDENVDLSYPILVNGDVIEISGKEDFEIYGITSSGTIKVFVVVTAKD